MKFHEVHPGVLVLRYPVLDVNVTVILGDSAAVVVDTLSTTRQGTALAAAVTAITNLPLILINTHHHFDHCFGNSAFPGAEIWAHESTAHRLREHPRACVRQAYEEFGTQPGLEDLPATTIVPPNRLVHDTTTLALGGRNVTIRHLGRGHTAGDLVVTTEGVVIAGDLIEEGAAPSFEDSYPLTWPETLAQLLELCGPGPVVPGHGAIVTREFVAAQHTQLAALDWLIRDGHADGAPEKRVAQRAAADWDLLSPPAALTAVRRGYAELKGIA